MACRPRRRRGWRASRPGRSFFPSLITQPFADGLRGAFAFSVAATLVAAVASWLRGGKYLHAEAGPGRAQPAAARGGSAAGGPAQVQALVPAEPCPEDLAEDLAGQVGRWREQAIRAGTPRLVVAISGASGAGGA